jgi:hypothetical protein
MFKKPKILDTARSSTLGKRSRIATLLEKKHHMFYHIPVYKADKSVHGPVKCMIMMLPTQPQNTISRYV